MNTKFLEKVGLSLLLVAWLIFGINALGSALAPSKKLDKPAIEIAIPEPAKPADSQAAPAMDQVTSLDPDKGAKGFSKCKACHNVESGASHKVGPNLWNLVSHGIAGADGYAYSEALSGKGGDWTPENLDAFLKSPADFAPGTKMTFKGISDAQDRWNLVAWLSLQADGPITIDPPHADAAMAAVEQTIEQAVEQAAETVEKVAAETVETAKEMVEQAAVAIAGDAAEGEARFAMCKSCHTVTADGKHKLGPNLHDVVGRAIGGAEGYAYSGALKGVGGTWTAETLDQFLQGPKEFAPGTKMTFPGLPDAEMRANLIAYLQSLQ